MSAFSREAFSLLPFTNLHSRMVKASRQSYLSPLYKQPAARWNRFCTALFITVWNKKLWSALAPGQLMISRITDNIWLARLFSDACYSLMNIHKAAAFTKTGILRSVCIRYPAVWLIDGLSELISQNGAFFRHGHIGGVDDGVMVFCSCNSFDILL